MSSSLEANARLPLREAALEDIPEIRHLIDISVRIKSPPFREPEAKLIP